MNANTQRQEHKHTKVDTGILNSPGATGKREVAGERKDKKKQKRPPLKGRNLKKAADQQAHSTHGTVRAWRGRGRQKQAKEREGSKRRKHGKGENIKKEKEKNASVREGIKI